ncbi:Golgi to ER traffic protein 4 homolog [Watersipora subatra]|uniref:Golgi to ER traffic protein 4 homolog n=1 Tax=Watersipora subatra TaxID=2589382 RepID=UPI00355C0A48
MDPTSSSQTKTNGVSRIVSKLESSIANGNYYEAHQLYKTLSHRLTSKQKHGEAINYLYTGACMLLRNKQIESGADLAMTLLDVLNKLDSDSKLQYISKLSSIHALIPPDAVERRQFVSKSIKCTKTATCTAGSPEFHKALAITLWQEKSLHAAQYHFLYATDGENFGKFLADFHCNHGGYPYEVDLFIAQIVLQLLCLKNWTTANVTFCTYVNSHPDVQKEDTLFYPPLLNFLHFLLQAVKDGMSLQVFAILCEKYQVSLSRDPIYKTYLDKIGQNFFGVPAPAGSGGLLGGLLGSLFSGASEEDVETHTMGPTSSQPRQPQSPRTFETSDLD